LLPGPVDELKQALLATSPKGGSEQAATRLARHVPQATAWGWQPSLYLGDSRGGRNCASSFADKPGPSHVRQQPL